MARLRQGRSLIRTPRRQTAWGGGPKSAANGAAGPALSASAAVLGSIISAPTSDGVTLIRTRGMFMFKLRTADAVFTKSIIEIINLGIGIFNDQALVAGVASLNSPLTDEFWDGWLWHQYFSVFSTGAISAAGASVSGGQQDALAAAYRTEVDSKAMRKVPVGQSLAVVLETAETGTAVGDWYFNTRVLSKLP